MKIRLCLLLLFTGIFCQAFCQVALTDLKAVPYAKNVKDWQDNPVGPLLLDIYYPNEANTSEKYPTVLFLQGGNFLSSDRSNVSEVCDYFAAKGFIAVSIDYRVGYMQSTNSGSCHNDTIQSKTAIYRAMQDANASLRFLSANAGKYYIDTSRLFIGGVSAGADLSYYSAYVNDSVASIIFKGFADTLGTLQTSGNSLPYNYTLKGLCIMWGGMPVMPSGQELISASYRAYPTILFQGALDPGLSNGYGHISGCDNYPRNLAGIGVYDLLTALRVPAVYHFSPTASHEAYDDIFCVDQAGCFFNALMNGIPYSGYYTYYNPSCR